jgi:hypothetical protein
MRVASSLLEQVGGLLVRTYRIRVELDDLGRFVIGDHGFRLLYGHEQLHHKVDAPGTHEAKILLRETDEGVRACIYYPDALIASLERQPPHRGLHDGNVEAFAVLVEELDHLLCLAERAEEERPVTLFELELHANVSKALVLARYLAGRDAARPLSESRRAWLRRRLFDRASWGHDDSEVEARYRDAARWAVRLLDSLDALPPAGRLEALRRFHSEGASGKLEVIESLAVRAG